MPRVELCPDPLVYTVLVRARTDNAELPPATLL
jgi:hypothetical protein